MSQTQMPPAPQAPAGSGMSRTGWISLIVVLSLVVLVVLAGAVYLAIAARGAPIDISQDLDAGRSVAVDLPNAALTFRPSSDGQVHVTADGSYFGREPRVTAETANGVTTITGRDCETHFFSRCSMEVTVSLPRSLDLTVEGQNGRISASGLTGDLTLVTTNGRIETARTDGTLDLQSTNGAVSVRNSSSGLVTATTTNGSVELNFVDAPTTVEARSTNGAVTVLVPDDGEDYFVDAATTNGSVNTGTVPSDRQADRSITVRSTNGSVTVAAN